MDLALINLHWFDLYAIKPNQAKILNNVPFCWKVTVLYFKFSFLQFKSIIRLLNKILQSFLEKLSKLFLFILFMGLMFLLTLLNITYAILCLTDIYQLIGPVDRVFANGPGDLGSIPVRVIPKTFKMVLDASLLNTLHYKVRIKGKVEQSRGVVAIEKGAFWLPRLRLPTLLMSHGKEWIGWFGFFV